VSSLFFEHDPYAGLELRPADTQGWTQQPAFLRHLMRVVEPRLVIEVGVWKGFSSLVMAREIRSRIAAPANTTRGLQGGGVVLSIDTWQGAAEFWERRFTRGQYDPERDLKWKNGFPQVYFQFLSNVVHEFHDAARTLVIPFPAPARIAFEVLLQHGVQADLIYIDASHSYADVCGDIAAYFRLLRDGGVLVGDDYDPVNWRGVVQAVEEFVAATQLKLFRFKQKWYVRKGLYNDTYNAAPELHRRLEFNGEGTGNT
jgi:hypothetical protein